VERDLTRLNMIGRCLPSFLDDVNEAGQPKPKVFKLEGSRLPGATIMGEEERVMV
jgi:hypothetical protein